MEDIPFNSVKVKPEAPHEIIDSEATDNIVNDNTEIDEYDSNGEENVGDYVDVIVKEESWLEMCKIEENSCGIKTERENEGNEIQEDTNKSRDVEKHVQSSSCDKPLGENRIDRKCLDKTTHDDERHKCNICDKTFLFRKGLNEHMKTHPGEKPDKKLFNCELCGERFTWKFNLTRHMLVHNKPQPRKWFKCELCNKYFGSQDVRDAHQEAHAGRTPFKCEYCAKTFIQETSYQHHMLMHSDYGFDCRLCRKRFEHKLELDQHMLVHTDEKPFKCSMCASSFKYRSSRGKHMLKHNENK